MVICAKRNVGLRIADKYYNERKRVALFAWKAKEAELS